MKSDPSSEKAAPGTPPNKQDIQLSIATPTGVYDWAGPKTTKVEEVIAQTIQAMGLDGGDKFELVHQGKVLSPVERPLVSFGIETGAKLELVATGTGV